MTDFLSLDKLLTRSRLDDYVCAITDDGVDLSWANWIERFSAWRLTLEKKDGIRWAVYEENCFEFSAILFALWSLGKQVYLPGNCQPGYLASLENFVDGFVGDFESIDDSITRPTDCEIESNHKPAPHELNTIDPLLYVFTSGSTGEPQAIPKNLTQLSAELDTLHQQWGIDIDDAHVVASVSHQHIYGLLFRCLWPLLEGWSFDTHTRQYTEKFIPPKRGSGILISSPTHLSRLPPHDVEKRSFNLVFCSGAPLDYCSSQQAKLHFQCPVTEVLGSTETGGMAWRQQFAEHTNPWTTFDCVEFELATASQCLRIRSPYLENPDHWFETNDRAERLNDMQFTLKGRIDRIIKVEGKRLSLDDMEQKLKQHPNVKDAYVLPLPDSSGRLGAVICLDEAPAVYDVNTKRSWNTRFRDFLLNHFERPMLPRKWRYLDSLPRNSQGKFNIKDMTKIFSDQTPRPTEATILSTKTIDDEYHIDLNIPQNLVYFDGHFDQVPILPGVVQLQWAEKHARNLFGLSGDFKRLEVLKFKKIATPGMTLTLTLKYDQQSQKIDFKYTSSIGQHASGRIVLEA